MVRAQTVYAVGGYAIPDFASPDPIGSSTPNSGVFTTLAASGAVSGAGFTARFSAPGPIGDVTPSTGAFTTLSATNFSTTKSTADVEGPSVTNTSTNAAAAAAYSAFNSAGDYVICSVLSTNAALTDQFGPGYGVVYSLKKMCLSSSDNGVFINVNGGTLVGTFTSTGLQVTGTVKSTAGTGTAEPVMVGTISVNTTAVGNVGAGTDDLMTYALPANSLSANGKGVRITVWGRCANNANSKTVALLFGSTSVAIPTRTSVDHAWRAVCNVIRTGSGAQILSAEVHGSTVNLTTVSDNGVSESTPAETDTGAITIKCTGAGTADNDIVQKGMIVEFIS